MGTKVTGSKGSTDVAGSGKASGAFAHAEGAGTVASDTAAHAEGNSTTASGAYSHAEGSSTQASNAFAHAEGDSTTASGGSAHAEGSATIASGANSHAEGTGTWAQASNAHAEGNGSQATGAAAHAEGSNCFATGASSHAEGNLSQANGQTSHAQGWQALASRIGQDAQAAGQFAAAGDAQSNVFVAHRQTTDATASTLFFDGGTTATLTTEATNVLTVPVNRAHQFRVEVIARRSDVSGDAAGWEFCGVIVRGSSGNAAFAGTVQGQAWGTAGAAAWDVTLAIDTSNATNNYLAITVTGLAAQTIRWVATITTTEVG